MLPFACRLLALCLAAAAFAQTATAADPATAAHLFGYRAHPGQREAFDAGYRRHLDWHRQRRDPLVWYGWYVSDGPHAGMFVDGTFGAPFAAFDARVDPAGDGADAAANVIAHGDPVLRASYRLRRDLSSGFPLEQRQPPARLQVTRYQVRPGMRADFERAVRLALAALPAGAASQTWYEPVSGAAPGYLRLVARDGWADYDRGDDDLDALLARSRDPDVAAVRAGLAAAVIAADTETWDYRADLSYLPPAR